MRVRIILCWLAYAFAVAASYSDLAAEEPLRYLGRRENGAWIDGEQLTDWYTTESVPLLDGQPLDPAQKPLRWLIDRRLPLPETPASYVEFSNGDRVGGIVRGYRARPDDVLSPPREQLRIQIATTSGHIIEGGQISTRAVTSYPPASSKPVVHAFWFWPL